jgi:signal transduction histidine kinase
MKQRIKEIDGVLELVSTPGSGAKVILRCPLTVQKALMPE